MSVVRAVRDVRVPGSGRGRPDWTGDRAQRSAEQSERDRTVVFRRDNRDSKSPDTFTRQLETLRAQPRPETDEQDGFLEEAETGYDREPAQLAPRMAPAITPAPSSPTYGRDSGSSTPVSDQSPYTTSQPTSVIAADTIWRGDMESNGDVHIHGQYQGTITSRTDIFVSEDAEADATLIANSVVVAGNVKGTIRATTRLEILPQGRISGEVIAPTVVAHDGSRINATVRMTLTAEEQAGSPPRVSTTTRRTARSASRY